MALQILDASPDSEGIVAQLREAIERAIPGAGIDVRAASPGHYEIRVTTEVFAGQSRVKQHQLVYAAIAHLMSGDAPPVHAVDRLECQTP